MLITDESFCFVRFAVRCEQIWHEAVSCWSVCRQWRCFSISSQRLRKLVKLCISLHVESNTLHVKTSNIPEKNIKPYLLKLQLQISACLTKLVYKQRDSTSSKKNIAYSTYSQIPLPLVKVKHSEMHRRQSGGFMQTRRFTWNIIWMRWGFLHFIFRTMPWCQLQQDVTHISPNKYVNTRLMLQFYLYSYCNILSDILTHPSLPEWNKFCLIQRAFWRICFNLAYSKSIKTISESL